MRRTILLPLLMISLAAVAQNNPVQLVNPPALATPRGYSHAAVIDLGNCKMIIISGQVALDKQGNLVGKDDVAKQTEQVFQNIKSIVDAYGGSMNNIVKLGYFITDVSKVQAVRNVRDTFINTQNPPASTLVQVSKLFRDDILIEIEATAVIPVGK
ncbi:MAG: RidA family protein [Chitinophagaceae bacterium]